MIKTCTAKTAICDRCGDGADIRPSRRLPEGWRSVFNPFKNYGTAPNCDLCPRCVADLQLWWHYTEEET